MLSIGTVLPAQGNRIIPSSLPAAEAARLWDCMEEMRSVPLNVRKISETKVPLAGMNATHWADTGDSWVKGENTGTAPVTQTSGQAIVEEYFFDSGMTPDGPNRVFFAYARPESTNRKFPLILSFHGGGGHGSSANALAMVKQNPGCASFSMDYNGQFQPGSGNVTSWKSVTKDNRNEKRLRLAADLRNWHMFHYVMAARRLIDVAGEFPEIDQSRIGCVGISYGGWVSLFLAGVDDRIKSVSTAVSAGGMEGTASKISEPLRWEPAEQRVLWLANYDPIVYASKTKAGVLLEICADDKFFWLSGAEKHYFALAGEKRMLVRPNSDHLVGGPQIPETIPAWNSYMLLGGEALPQIDGKSITARDESYTWIASGPVQINKATLHWSPGITVSCARYWVNIPAVQVDGMWKASIPARFKGLASRLYVTVFDAKGRAVSCPSVKRDGIDPQTTFSPLWANDSLWDIERGANAWRPIGGGPDTKIQNTQHNAVLIGPSSVNGIKQSVPGKFAALSGSVVLGSGQAASRNGIKIHVNGAGSAGAFAISIIRDSFSLDEVRYTATVKYSAESEIVAIEWKEFKLVRQKTDPLNSIFPFNGILIEGERSNITSLEIGAIELF